MQMDVFMFGVYPKLRLSAFSLPFFHYNLRPPAHVSRFDSCPPHIINIITRVFPQHTILTHGAAFRHHSIVRTTIRSARLSHFCRTFRPELRLVRANHVPNDGPAQRTMAAADAAPLLDGALVAHAHVAAHVQHRIDWVLVANRALGAGRQAGIGGGRRRGGIVPLAEGGEVLRIDGLEE